MEHEVLKTFLKNLPGVAASAWTYVFNLSLERWVLLATFIHISLQIFFMLRHAWRVRQNRK